jgi:serine/threonine-protein kinase
MAEKGPEKHAEEGPGKENDKGQSTENAPTPRGLGQLVALGMVAALWALFQWSQLMLARMGASTFCSLDATFDCAAVWDSAFASAIHSGTGIPIAGWGLMWGLVATALPLLALIRTARFNKAEPYYSATGLVAAVGAFSVVILFGASVAEGHLCLTCLVTYVVVLAYVGVFAFQFKAKGATPQDLQGGILFAAGFTAVAFAIAIVPGMRTPHAKSQAEKEALAQIEKTRPNAHSHTAGDGHDHGGAHTHGQAQPNQGQGGAQAAVGNDPISQQLVALLGSLNPQMKQAMADSLHMYKGAANVPLQEPRGLLGDKNAPLRITEFTDVLCGHCANLHATIKELKRVLPAESFSVEARHFPLDAGCNPLLPPPAKLPVRCIAAKAQICLEGRPGAFAFSGSLFENQQGLDEKKVMSLATAHIPEPDLKRCMTDPATLGKLNADIQWAGQHHIEGTPLVLLNGKKASSFGPFLYAMILTGGNANHPAFATLPPANPNAHIH